MRFARALAYIALVSGAFSACEITESGERRSAAAPQAKRATTGGNGAAAGATPASGGDGAAAGTTTANGGDAGGTTSSSDGGAGGECHDSVGGSALSFGAPPIGDPPARYFAPTRWSLGPFFGTGCPLYGECESGGTMVDEVNFDLDQLARHDIPITMYHLDGGGWSDGACRWSLGDALRARLAEQNVRALVHYWGGCRSPADFERLYSGLGPTLGGLYLDDGMSEDDPGATGALTKGAIDWFQSRLPGDFEVVLKAYRTFGPLLPDALSAYGHSAYVNDLSSDFEGLRVGVERVLSLASALPAPFNEFTGYDPLARPEEETYFRRIHFGALQPVMDHSPWHHASPWESGYSPELLADYRYFAWLHYELVPYIHSYDYLAYLRGDPILRQSDPSRATTKLGEEIFVAYVLEPGTRELSVTLPPGEWLDYWDPSQVHVGTVTVPVPLGHEPIFIANGSIIPMQVSRDYTGHGSRNSEGSLTLLIYPKGDSRFWYREDATERWIGIGSELRGDVLTLDTSATPTQPILYRVERWDVAPVSVRVRGTRVTVNGARGQASAPSEEAVNGARESAWYYDAGAHRLIVKAVP